MWAVLLLKESRKSHGAAVRLHVAVKLNAEKVKDPSLAEVREVTVRTEKERCTLLVKPNHQCSECGSRC